MQKLLFSVSESCEYANLSDHTIRKAIAQLQLPAIRPGGVLRVRKADLDAWLESAEPYDGPDPARVRNGTSGGRPRKQAKAPRRRKRVSSA